MVLTLGLISYKHFLSKARPPKSQTNLPLWRVTKSQGNLCHNPRSHSLWYHSKKKNFFRLTKSRLKGVFRMISSSKAPYDWHTSPRSVPENKFGMSWFHRWSSALCKGNPREGHPLQRAAVLFVFVLNISTVVHGILFMYTWSLWNMKKYRRHI